MKLLSSEKKALVLLSSFLTHQESFGFLSSEYRPLHNSIVKNHRQQPESLQAARRQQEYTAQPPTAPRRRNPRVPVPHFSVLANFTSSSSIEEWLQSPPVSHQDEKLKAAFYEWSSKDQARFIVELGKHGESQAVIIFLQKYGRPTTIVYNAALSTLANLGCSNQVYELASDMQAAGIPPTAFTLATIFRSLSGTDQVIQIRNQFLGHQNLWTAEVFEAAILGCIGDSDSNQVWETILKIMGWMDESGVPATTPIYQAMFQACVSMQNASSTLVSSLLEKVIHLARENSQLPRFDDRLWGTILQAFAAARDDAGALQVLRLMNENGLKPNSRHCTIFIKTLSLSKKNELVLQFLNTISRLPCSVEDFQGLATELPDQITVLAVLSVLSANGDYPGAKHVLENMKARAYGEDAPPNEQAYNFVLSCCPSPQLAREIIREMRLTRRHRTGVIAPSLRTYSRAIAVCRRQGDLEMALTLLDGVKDDGFEPDVYVYSAVIWTAAEAGDCERAMKLLREMEFMGVTPNIVSYNGLLSAYANAQKFDMMARVFQEIQCKTAASSTTFNILARAARKIVDHREKLSFLEEIYDKMIWRDKHVKIGGRLIESLVFALGSQGRFDEAKEAFETLEGPSDAPNLRAMLFACSNADPPAWEHALNLLHTSDIFFQSRPPAYVDSVSLAYAMLACSKADRWEEALNLLNLYGSKDTSVVAFNSLIAACGRCSRPDVAIEVLNEMEAHGIDPDELSFRNAIIACNQAEHAEARSRARDDEPPEDTNREHEQPMMFEWWECALSLLRRMKESGRSPDIQTYSSVISACEAAGQWQRALGVLQGMAEGDKNLYCLNAAISACEKGGAWVEAVELYERMKERGNDLKPNFVTISGVVQALDAAGQKEMAQSIYEEGAASGAVKPWKMTKDFRGQPVRVLDLHSFSVALARATVRSYLESLLSRQRTLRDDLVVVVGKGLRSSSEPVLGSAVSRLIFEEYGIMAQVDEFNAGRLNIAKKELQRLIDARGWS